VRICFDVFVNYNCFYRTGETAKLICGNNNYAVFVISNSSYSALYSASLSNAAQVVAQVSPVVNSLNTLPLIAEATIVAKSNKQNYSQICLLYFVFVLAWVVFLAATTAATRSLFSAKLDGSSMVKQKTQKNKFLSILCVCLIDCV
jgi:hypothetical protein